MDLTSPRLTTGAFSYNHPIMKIGLTYDLRSEYLAAGYTEDETAEFDRESTVEGLENALRELGHTPVRIGHARQLIQKLVSGEEWDLVVRGPHNLLLVATPSDTSEMLVALKSYLRAPLHEYTPTGGPVPQTTEGTLVLFEVARLNEKQQRQLLQWLDQINDLDTSCKHFLRSSLIVESWCVAMDRASRREGNGASFVNRIANNINDSAERSFTHRHGYWPASVDGLHPPDHSVRWQHRHGSHATLTQVVLDFTDDIDWCWDFEAIACHPQGLVDWREF